MTSLNFTSFNFADMFERLVDVAPARAAVIADGVTRSYAETEERANRLAHHLAGEGFGPGDHVGIYAYNGFEWVEGMLALYKIRAVPVNINYRYVEGELLYLFDNADLVGLIAQREFAPRIASVRSSVPALRHVILSDDGSGAAVDGLDHVDLEHAVAAGSPERDFGPRSGDDVHMIFTGGSTGMPKGVVWRQEDIYFALAGGIDAYTKERVASPEQPSERVRDGAGPLVMYPLPPLMHGAGQIGTLRSLVAGDTTVLSARFDPDDAWRTAARERVNVMFITGDAMARPLADALERLHGELDLSGLLSFSSSAAIFSPSLKEQFLRLLPGVIIVDSIGATETGMNGMQIAKEGEAEAGGVSTVDAAADTIVVDDDLAPLPPGSPEIGWVARTGNVPLGYYKDPERSARTFFEVDGRRYAVAGDMARHESDGRITLLGRGSVMINTGGEKVFPEEVEGVLKGHPDVFDALVVGLPDERWGQRVTAVVQPRPGARPTAEELAEHCRGHIARYKVPRQVFLVEEVVRAPSGKPDYPWAKRYAEEAAAAGG